MYVQIKNENYGYSVATLGDFVAVGNPGFGRYSELSSSLTYSGSVDVFKYNYGTNEHDYLGSLYKTITDSDILLATELSHILHTEDTGSVASTNDLDLSVDSGLYVRMLEDGYGTSVDIYNNYLTIGCPYYLQRFEITSSGIQFDTSGSAIDIFDLTRFEEDSFNTPIANQSSSYVTSLTNPDIDVTSSFGTEVSINGGWIAVGSPYVSGSEGMVYLYKKEGTTNNFSWSLEQKIVPNDSTPGLLFGADLELNKVTGSRSGSLIVGIGNASGSKAFLFEYISGSWAQTYVFGPNNSSAPLTFGGYEAINETFTTASGYGTAVGIYNNTVVIGAPRDRTVQEFTSSTVYQQGAAYVYELCIGVTPTNYELVLKTYGNENIIKNNRLGYSVGIYGENIAIGTPKINVDSLDLCYIQDTLEQLHFCNSDLENTLEGQYMYLQKNTTTDEWDISKMYQRKKKYLNPYRSFGYAVDVGDRSMVIGAPMNVINDTRQINVSTTSSLGFPLGDISGKAYIYNFEDYNEEFHIGNVFYRNGEIIVNTSGSIFDGLFFNPISEYTYEYQVDFKGEHTIFEKQIVCSVEPGEFNVSTNPSAITRNISTWDINGNGYFDFQDVDVLLSYMQYKNTQVYNSANITTNWSSSIVITDDEQSLLRYYKETYDSSYTQILINESIQRFEFTDTWMKTDLDLNQDNRINTNDINILWKYFAKRLTQENYSSYINPSCNRQLFSEIIDHLNQKTQVKSLPLINSEFFEYERLSNTDNTGSFLAPMATTIGLYMGLDIVAVAKLGSPIKISNELPINFVVKMDF
jgi:hypothetical protein